MLQEKEKLCFIKYICYKHYERTSCTLFQEMKKEIILFLYMYKKKIKTLYYGRILFSTFALTEPHRNCRNFLTFDEHCNIN